MIDASGTSGKLPLNGVSIVSRRYLSPSNFPAGSYVTRPQPSPGNRIFAPVAIHADELDGSQPGDLEPLLLRVDGLDAESAPHITLELEGVAQQIRPFTYSPQKFYVADLSRSINDMNGGSLQDQLLTLCDRLEAAEQYGDGMLDRF